MGKINHSIQNLIFQTLQWTGFIILLDIHNVATVTIENVALNKPASMSGITSGRGPENAVDGTFCTLTSSDGMTSQTNQISNPWWKVDLTAVYTIRYVVIQTSGILN